MGCVPSCKPEKEKREEKDRRSSKSGISSKSTGSKLQTRTEGDVSVEHNQTLLNEFLDLNEVDQNEEIKREYDQSLENREHTILKMTTASTKVDNLTDTDHFTFEGKDGVQTDILEGLVDQEYKLEKIYDVAKGNKLVYDIRSKDPNKKYVVKVSKIKANNYTRLDKILTEFNIGRTLSEICENIAAPKDLKFIKNKEQTEVRAEMLIEKAGISLDKINPPLEGEELINAMYQLANTCIAIESMGVAHFDLKPENVCYSTLKHQVKLIDFGESFEFYRTPQKLDINLAKESMRIRGFTQYYAPPEIITLVKNKKKTYDDTIIPQKVDVFLYGITFACALLIPHNLNHIPRLSCKHEEFMLNLRLALYQAGEMDWIPLINNCMRYNPAERSTFIQIKNEIEQKIKEKYYNTIKIVNRNDFPEKKIFELIFKYFNKRDYRIAAWFIKKAIEGPSIQQVKEFGINCPLITAFYELLGRCYFELAEYDNAQNAFNVAIKYGEKYGNNADFIKVLMDLFLSGSSEIRFEKLNSSLLKDAYLKAGDAQSELGLYENAIQSYFMAVEGELSRSNFDVLLGINKIYTKLGINSSFLDVNKLLLMIPDIIKYEHKFCDKISNGEQVHYYYTKEERKYIDTLIETNKNEDLSAAELNAYSGNIALKEGNFDRAIVELTKSLNIYKKIVGGSNIKVASVYADLGSAYLGAREFGTCINSCEKALELYSKFFNKVPIDVAHIYETIGDAQRGRKEFEIALKKYETCEKIYQSHRSEEFLRRIQQTVDSKLKQTKIYLASCFHSKIVFGYIEKIREKEKASFAEIEQNKKAN